MTVKKLAGSAAVLAATACLTTALPATAQPTGPPSSATTTAPPSTTTAPPSTTVTEEPTSSTTSPGGTDTADPGEGAITERYESLPTEVRKLVGEPTAEEVLVDDELRYRDHENARFYWTPEHGVKIVFGGILDKFLALGGHEVVGVPTTDELGTEDGARYGEFVTAQGSVETAIYYTEETGAHLMRGMLLQHWRGLGAGEGLGYPTTDTLRTPDGEGRYNHFLDDDGTEASIYWTQPTGPRAVQGAIRDEWASGGWEAGPLGYPTTDELTSKDGVGKYNHFTGDGTFPAVVAWSAGTGAHSVRGTIAAKYLDLYGPSGTLGFPTTDELGTPDGRGRFNHFTGTGGASIYWTGSTGAHAVYGAIRDRWARLGWERSYLGYPLTDEFEVPWGRSGEFEHGYVDWHRDTGEVFDFPRS